jgi:hypothetical protein
MHGFHRPGWLLAAAVLVATGSVLAQYAARAPAPVASPAPEAPPWTLDLTGAASPEQLAHIRRFAQEQFDRKDFGAAILWAQRYIKAGGPEGDVRPLLVQAYLRSGDMENAARELQWEVREAERTGRPPAEERLLLLQSCYAKLSDANAYSWVLEKLVAYYPKKEYWIELLDRTERRPDFGEPLALDVNRLRLATGAFSGPQAWLQFAAQAQQAGYPGEAKTVIERGIARGVLGTGADAQRHRQLLQQYANEAQAQQRRLADPQVEAGARKAADGIELVNLGFSYVTLGDYGKGIPFMEQGIRKGGGLANKPQFAKLRLGVAYFMAGDKPHAVEMFRTIGGKHGGADLGRIWAIHAAR